MGTLRTRKRCRSDTGSGLPRLHLDLHALVVKELHTRPPMSSSTPVLPEERRIPNDKRMEQDAHTGSGLLVSLPCHWRGFRRGQGRQLRMLAPSTMRRLPSASRRCS